jgi:hypothetical protein
VVIFPDRFYSELEAYYKERLNLEPQSEEERIKIRNDKK